MQATFKIVGLQEKAPKLETAKTGKKYARISLTVEGEDGRKVWFNGIMLWDSMAEDFVSKTKADQMIELTGTIYVKSETDLSSNKKYSNNVLDVKKFKVVSGSEEKESEPEANNDSSDADTDVPDFDSIMNDQEDKS